MADCELKGSLVATIWKGAFQAAVFIRGSSNSTAVLIAPCVTKHFAAVVSVFNPKQRDRTVRDAAASSVEFSPGNSPDSAGNAVEFRRRRTNHPAVFLPCRSSTSTATNGIPLSVCCRPRWSGSRVDHAGRLVAITKTSTMPISTTARTCSGPEGPTAVNQPPSYVALQISIKVQSARGQNHLSRFSSTRQIDGRLCMHGAAFRS